VEAAFVLPFLLLLTFGIFTVARAWQVNNAIDHAAREAARYGATIDPWVEGSGPGTSEEAVKNAVEIVLSANAIPTGEYVVCSNRIGAGTGDSCATPPIPEPPAGTRNVVVQVTWSDYELNFLFFTVEIDLTGTALSRWEE
jgi:hypothetical protein